jgi:hypothetical protein
MSMIKQTLCERPLVLLNGSMKSHFVNFLQITDFNQIHHFDIESGHFNAVKMHLKNNGYVEAKLTTDYREAMAFKKQYKNHCIIVKEFIPAIYNFLNIKPHYHVFSEE